MPIIHLERPSEFDDDSMTREYDAVTEDSDDFGDPDDGDDLESIPDDDDDEALIDDD